MLYEGEIVIKDSLIVNICLIPKYSKVVINNLLFNITEFSE